MSDLNFENSSLKIRDNSGVLCSDGSNGSPCWGVSLIECLIIISVVTTFVSVSNLSSLVENSEKQLSAASLYYQDIFEFARKEALKRGYPVIACQTNDRSSCSDSYDINSHWMVYAVKISNGGILTEKHVLMQKEKIDISSNALNISSGLYRVDFNNFGYVSLSQEPKKFVNHQAQESEVKRPSHPISIAYRNSPYGESYVGIDFNVVGQVVVFR